MPFYNPEDQVDFFTFSGMMDTGEVVRCWFDVGLGVEILQLRVDQDCLFDVYLAILPANWVQNGLDMWCK